MIKMIKNIIFDLGNIIVKNPNLELVEKFFNNKKDAKSVYEYIFMFKYWKDLDLGKITNEEAAKEIINNNLIKIENKEELNRFILEWYMQCIPNINTMELGKKLKKKGYNIYVLSNMAINTYNYFEKIYNFFENIDGKIVSGFVGVRKPNIEIFNLLLEKYMLNPEECLLIDDDDTNKTFEIANKIGIKGRRVKPNNTEDINSLLRDYNIEI